MSVPTIASYANSSSWNVSTLAAAASGSQTAVVTIGSIMKWVYLGVGISGIVGNIFVIIVVSFTPKLKEQPRNWLIVNQSVADMLSCVFIICNALKYGKIILRNNVGGLLVCIFWLSNYLSNFSSMASTYLLAAFTVEVYLAVVHPVFHKNVVTHRTVSFTEAIIWIVSSGYPLVTWTQTAKVVNGLCYPTYHWLGLAVWSTLLSFVVRMVLPVACYCICYFLVARNLRSQHTVHSYIGPPHSSSALTQSTTARALPHVNQIEKDASPENKIGGKKARDKFWHARRNVALTVFYTIILHIITWTGSQVQLLFSTFGYALDSNSPLAQVLQLLIYCNSCVNPIIYVIKYERFREGVARIIRQLSKTATVSVTLSDSHHMANVPGRTANHFRVCDVHKKVIGKEKHNNNSC